MSEATPSWQERAAAKRAANAALLPGDLILKSLPGSDIRNVTDIPRTSGLLSERELEITEASVSGLVADLASGKYTAVETTTAFIKRAVIAQQLVNPLTETFFDKALARAQELDSYFRETGKTVGPLHGLPISLKDQIEVEGTECTMSYVGWIGNVAKHTAVIAEILLKQGAVLYCRTNMSQGLWFGEGYNNVYGRTLNPHNRDLTCGGSSGGEGALIGLRGALLGVGSDIGGSVRIPAAYNGLYGMRGSYARIPYSKASNSSEGQEIVNSILGPLSATVDGLKLFYQAVLAAQPWEYDPWTPRMPWSDDAYNLRDHGSGVKLCFGIMWDDGAVKPLPPYIRALEITKKALLAAGHKVIDWKPYKSAEAAEILGRIFTADGGKDLRKQTESSGEPILGAVIDHDAPELGTYDFFQLCHRRTDFIKGALDHWNSTAEYTSTGRPVDAIIAPVSAAVPSKHDAPMWIGYSGFGNLADYSASVFPVTKVIPEVDVAIEAHEFRSEIDKDTYEAYEPEYYRDAPIGLQCIGKKHEEEAVIRMTEIIAAALSNP